MKLCRIFLILLLVILLPVGAMAASEASALDAQAQVGPDGSCQFSMTVTLHLDTPAAAVYFPLPADAQAVALNGGFVTTSVIGDKLLVILPNLTAGDYQFVLTYRLPSHVERDGEDALLTLPLLSGFGYPIRALEISLTLPGPIENPPQFISGYHQGDIAAHISTEISGSTMKITLLQPLKDHETLTMTLAAPAALFPQLPDEAPLLDLWDGMVLVCLVLAVLYYLLTLMPRFAPRCRCFTPPDGIHAGEVGLCLTGTGVDLTLMVFSWAQLGYLQLELRGKKKVLLHKRMEMGNERREFEVRVFQSLFGGRRVVDGTGVHYAKLCRKVAMQKPMLRQLFKPVSGRPVIFRLLSCAAGSITGVKLGLAIQEQATLSVLLAIACCILCGAFSYFIQAGGKCLPLRNKTPMAIALGCGGIWIALGVLTGRSAVVVPMVLFQFLCGFAIAFGGRRSELGTRSLSQIRGLRRYMARANTFELQQRLQNNSNYYYELAPYALALGIDRRFARRFGKTVLPDNGAILCGKHPRTASEWAALLRHMADILNTRQKQLPYQRITGR